MERRVAPRRRILKKELIKRIIIVAILKPDQNLPSETSNNLVTPTNLSSETSKNLVKQTRYNNPEKPVKLFSKKNKRLKWNIEIEIRKSCEVVQKLIKTKIKSGTHTIKLTLRLVGGDAGAGVEQNEMEMK